MVNRNDTSNQLQDFSLVLGGPLFQLWMRLRLTTPSLGLLKKRILCITLFAWLPLLLLSVIEGKALGGVELPFLYDFEVQIRLLVALPLLIGAELLVHKQMRPMVRQFIDRDIITGNALSQFRGFVTSAIQLRNSVWCELILLFSVFVCGHYLWNTVSVLDALSSGEGSWFASSSKGSSDLSFAGYWYIFVSRPLFQFIAFRWYFRIFIWARFLWQCSHLELNLIPTHPDRACGLGFLSMSSHLFAPLIVAHGALLAGLIANSIFYSGEQLPDSIHLIFSVVLFLLLIILGPLLVFSPKLMRTKRMGLSDYGVLASQYVGAFDLKWVRGMQFSADRLLGTSDIQSLADLSSSFQVVNSIRAFPFDKGAVFQLIFFALIPVLPLVLTMMPLQQIFKRLLQVVI